MTARDLLGLSAAQPAEQPVVAVSAPGSAGTTSTGSHVPAWKRIAHYVMHSAHLILEGAEIANVLTGAAVGGAIGATIIGVGMGALGVSHIVDGVRNKSGEMVLEGAGAVLVGVKSGLEAISLGGEHSHGAIATMAHSAHSYLAPLGVAHGAGEILLGGWGVYKGMHTKDASRVTSGVLSMGLGAAVCAASLGGGVPAVVAAGAFLAGRIVFEERQNFKAAMNGTAVPPSVRGWRFTS